MSTCVIIKLHKGKIRKDQLNMGKLVIAQRTGTRLVWLKMSTDVCPKLVIDSDSTPTRYDKEDVLVEAPMPVCGLSDHMIEVLLNHSFCSSNKLYFLELLRPWILPIRYDYWTNKYAPYCIDLTQDETDFRVIKKQKSLLRSSASLITIGPSYWMMILAFLTEWWDDAETVTTFVATNKQLYQSRSYLLSKIRISICICTLHNIRDCNPSELYIFDCKSYHLPTRKKNLLFDIQHLPILQAMTNLRKLRLHLTSNVSLVSLDQVQTLHIDAWKTSKKPMFPKSLVYLETHATKHISTFHGTYHQVRSLTLDAKSYLPEWKFDSLQFPNLLKLDINLQVTEFPKSLPPQLQQICEHTGFERVSLRQLAQCKDLQVIEVCNLGVDQPILSTDRFPNLQVLRFGKNSDIWTWNFLQDWKMQSLIELRVQDVECTNVYGLSFLPTLQILCLINCKNIEEISPLIALTSLNTLELWYCDKIQDFESLASIQPLKHLYYGSQKTENFDTIETCLRNSHVEILFQEPCPVQDVEINLQTVRIMFLCVMIKK